jgi:hypothetical protein
VREREERERGEREGREREGRERGEGGGTHLGHVRDGVPALA